MHADVSLKILTVAVAVALGIGGTAMANTNLDGTTTGDVFVNIVDTTNGTSFLFDTGVSQSTFNGGSNYSFNFASDPNYTAFLAAQGGGDNVDYSVFSATGAGTNTVAVLFTSSIDLPATRTAINVETGVSVIGSTSSGFLRNANSIFSSTTNSVDLSGTFQFGTALQEGKISNQLLNSGSANNAGGYADDAALGTALAFYEDATSSGAISINGQAFAGTWDVSGGVATYTGGTSAVPLPTPVLLLLSGLGLMGVVTRRSKTV